MRPCKKWGSRLSVSEIFLPEGVDTSSAALVVAVAVAVLVAVVVVVAVAVVIVVVVVVVRYGNESLEIT